jgi:TolB-like protein
VLPFQVLGGAPGDGYFAEGVTADIVTALGRFRSFTVVPADRAADARETARDLGVRYVLRGSVRRAADRLRLTAELVDGVAGTHLWAQSFDGTSDDVFDFQDRITESVATVIEPQIQAAELRRARRERPGSAAAYDIYLQARAKMLSESERENAEGYRLLTEALALDPTTHECSPTPPGPSNTAPPWAGHRSAPTTWRDAPISRAAASRTPPATRS